MNKSLEERYLSVIEDNVNVGKTDGGVEFLTLLAGLAAICFVVYIFAGAISSFFIDRMSNERQMQLERLLAYEKIRTVDEQSVKMDFLNDVKPKIVQLDKNLQGKAEFKLYQVDESQVNAFVMPDGKIYFTKGLLDKINSKEALTFVLAHEMGHYAHRDHLKSVGRELTAATILAIITFGQHDITSAVNGFSELNSTKHSRKQEEQADLYANHVLYQLYGRNTGAVKFFETLEKEENMPEFLHYFSTHPSNSRRLYLIKNNK